MGYVGATGPEEGNFGLGLTARWMGHLISILRYVSGCTNFIYLVLRDFPIVMLGSTVLSEGSAMVN